MPCLRCVDRQNHCDFLALPFPLLAGFPAGEAVVAGSLRFSAVVSRLAYYVAKETKDLDQQDIHVEVQKKELTILSVKGSSKRRARRYQA